MANAPGPDGPTIRKNFDAVNFNPVGIDGGFTARRFIPIPASGRGLPPYGSVKLPMRRIGNGASLPPEPEWGSECVDLQKNTREVRVASAVPKSAHMADLAQRKAIRTFRMIFSANQNISALFQVRIAGPRNFRGALAVISPIRTKGAPCPNPLYGQIATH